MAGMNGFQLAAAIREDARYHDLPVVFVTSLSDFDRVFGAADARNDVIAKPFLLMELAVKALTHLVPDRRPG